MMFAFDRNDDLVVDGLSAAASISIDRWGVCHIRAESMDDLWFAQGFNAARDRLWQLDIWRKRGLGRLSEDFGPGYLEQDRAARMFLYRGDMDAEWRAYADDAKKICARFAAGVNAYIALTEKEPERLPPEFAIVGTRPSRWAAEDIVRIRSHGLSRQAVSKVVRANVTAKAGAGVDDLRREVTPHIEPTKFDDLPLGDIPLDVIDAIKLATAQATFTPKRLAATLDQAGAWRKVNEFSEVMEDINWHGSNNWVVSASRSGTGKPLLASDPHRAHSLPSLRYIVHLAAPGFDAIGAGEPAVPGISLGHNGDIAFGLTIFGADHEDVYVYETHPDDPDLYRYEGAWERMRVVEEVIKVKGAPDQIAKLRFTRHGPVTAADAKKRRAYAVRSVWFEPGSAPYLASLSIMRARTLDEFRAGNARWGAPSINHLYADQKGTIAWMPGGRIPRRIGWNGLLPVPGDGRCEWQGFLPPSEYPERVNPSSGYAFSANEMNLPDDWPHEAKPVGFDWNDRARANRIIEAFAASERHGVDEAKRLQNDETSLPARRLCALVGKMSAGGDAEAPLALLRGFDGRLAADSAAAALFEIWWAKHLKPALFRRAAGEAASLLVPGDASAIVAALENPARYFGDDAGARDRLLIETLAAATRETKTLLGDDVASWSWGRLHHGGFSHPLAAVAGEARARVPDVGPLPMGGSGQTVKLASYRGSDFRVMHGASFRMIVDLADLDRSQCVNAPGQSGDPRSRHYDKLAPVWAASDYAPMLYSPAAIDAATEFVWRLRPA
ncbi:penicillin acylase family protein [Terrarubrum flagellatum]|uniref:penicillin acylase family protein n=1 Tax=Terrirubrum flagellatum TaxID=2895980 RepID=UPI0031454156